MALAMLMTACGQDSSGSPQAEALWHATAFGLDDKPLSLLNYRGHPLVVNFWARWCPPCREEIPDFVRAGRQFKSQGAELIGIAIEDDAAPIADYARQYGIDYPLLVAKDQGLPLMAALGNSTGALPFTVVFDRQGRIAAYKVGRMSRTEIDAAFAAALR